MTEMKAPCEISQLPELTRRVRQRLERYTKLVQIDNAPAPVVEKERVLLMDAVADVLSVKAKSEL